MLEVTNLRAGYNRLQVLWDVSLRVQEGEFVALIGPNGAGKTTTLRSIAGLIKPQDGEIRFLGKAISGLPAHRISQFGMSYITEDLNLFEAMTVYENLMLGAYFRHDRKKIKSTLEYVFELFPILNKRQKQLAGTLSGGERRMLAMGRGLMSDPHLLLIDEPSLGLAPKLVMAVFEALKLLHSRGLTILLVEQNVNNTLRITDKAYVLEHGKIVMSGPSQELVNDAFLKETYMGRR